MLLTLLLSSSMGDSCVLKRGTNPIQLASAKGVDVESIFGEDDDEEEVKEATMVGVDVSASEDEVAVVVGAWTEHFGGEKSRSTLPYQKSFLPRQRASSTVIRFSCGDNPRTAGDQLQSCTVSAAFVALGGFTLLLLVTRSLQFSSAEASAHPHPYP